MRKIIFLLSLCLVLMGQFGCESHHSESYREEEQEKPVAFPIEAPEHGGAAGNK